MAVSCDSQVEAFDVIPNRGEPLAIHQVVGRKPLATEKLITLLRALGDFARLVLV